jgi:hypothetical protein
MHCSTSILPAGDRDRRARIIADVLAATQMFLVIANPVIIRFRLPKWRTLTLQNPVGAHCRKLFPGSHYAGHGMIRSRPEYYMDMVRHHDPCPQLITLCIKEANRLRNQSRQLRGASTRIHLCRGPGNAQFCARNLFQSIPLPLCLRVAPLAVARPVPP